MLLIIFVDTIVTIKSSRAFDFIGKAVKNGIEVALVTFGTDLIPG